jgi:type VI secretion system protein ImpM
LPAEAVTIAEAEAPAYYGKLPAKGDFVTRRFSRAFIKGWDDWLQDAILSSREALGSQWLEVYLTSPIWRFALEAGCCGPLTVAGVLMPSVDKVGRYFPLTIGLELPAPVDLADLASGAQGWYQAVEDLALATLGTEFTLEALNRPIPLALDATSPSPTDDRGEPSLGACQHIALDPATGLAELGEAQRPALAGKTRWWTLGSQRVAPCLLVCPSLPPPCSFASMLDGVWQGRGWTTLTNERAAVTNEGEH